MSQKLKGMVPLTPMSDQDRISSYNINTISTTADIDENQEKY